MARALTGTLTLCLALGLTSIALGQQRQPPPQQAPNPLGPVLSMPQVQKELKLNDDQITKLKDALGKVMTNYKDTFTKLQKMSPEEQQKTFKALNDESQKAIAGVLDAKQMKRFRQIQWQMSGFGAIQDPELQKELKLSDDQKKKLDGIFNDATKRLQDMAKSPGTSREEFQKKYNDIIKNLEDKANGVLTDDQKKNLKELKGPPFEMAPPRGAR